MRFFLIKVIFSGVRGNGVFGDIAVDDISLAPGACGGMNLSTSENFKIDAYFFKFEQILKIH